MRTCLLAMILTLAARGAAANQAGPLAGRRPNIVVILVDDLGYGDLGCYGAEDLQSPAIDGLVGRGLRMDQFYANCPVCSPTRASLLTGRYPELVGVPGVIRTHAENSWGFLDPHSKLLPEALSEAGYHTAMIGKWHLGLEPPNLPTQRGFSLVHGFLGDMMDDYYDHRRHGNNYMRLGDKVINPKGHATDLFTQWACDYIRQRAGAEDDRPFFLYLAYNAPHTPIQPPPEWVQKVQRRHPELPEKRARLVALIEHLDQGVDLVLKTLNQTELEDDTLVVFTSDNGGQLSAGANNGNLRDGKQSVYEGGLKVPFCVTWPGRIEPGRRRPAALTMDLYPTICELAGAKPPEHLDGVSLLPVWRDGDAQLKPRDLFFHRREGGTRYQGLTISAIRRGDWKLLQNSPFAPFELYNLAEDPLEEHNQAQHNGRKFGELSAALRLQVQRGGAVPWQPPARRNVK